MRNPRLGHINFINCLPLTYSLAKDDFQQGLHLYAAVPSTLNEEIVKKRLDVSPVSSIVYACNFDNLILMPDVSIAADGEVQSITLVSKKPIDALANDKIILTAKSATSHCLLKIILKKVYGAQPRYAIGQINLKNIIPNDAAAALLIGDDALYAHHHHQAGLYYYDIGAEWKKFTGLAMVYAVWAVNRSFAEQKPEALQFIYERVTRGFKNGYEKKSAAIHSILADKPFTFEQIDAYLEVIKWDFTENYKKALSTFYRFAHEMHLIDHVPEIEFAEVSR